ncbi:MAG: type II toxin-antitoxin system HicA family toxin [Acidobacteriaceae bacterium]|nr:type II toxin-antitoxin system HicA family toxin [Acidobacteriaceae bacterium]
MAIDYRALRSLTARQLIAALLSDGFQLIRQTGSHQRYRHRDGRRVTIAPHGSGGTFPIKTLKSIIEFQACWSEDDPRRLNLLK